MNDIQLAKLQDIAKVTVRTIPKRLLPDAKYQFVIDHPYALVVDPDKPFNPLGDDLVPPELDQWFLYDSWGIEQACKLITLGYPVDLDCKAEQMKGWPKDCEGWDSLYAMATVYSRALSIAKSSVQVGLIKEHDTPANWIEWAKGKGYSVAHLMPADAHAAKVAKRSITKQRAINAFDGLHLDRAGWNNALSDVPKWIEPCRVSRGRKGDKSTAATWNPVLIATALFDKEVPIKKLHAVFVDLPDWADEWREAYALFRD